MALIDLLKIQWVSKIGQAWPIFLAVKKKRQHFRERVVGCTFQSSSIVEFSSISGPVGRSCFCGPVGSQPVAHSCFWVHL